VSNFREEVYNVCLAELLCERGIDALPVSIVRLKKMPDVRIFAKGVRIILEGKFYNKLKLDEQVNERVQMGLCDICIGIIYNSELKDANSIKEIKEKFLHGKFDIILCYQDEEGVMKKTFVSADLTTLIEIINKPQSEVYSICYANIIKKDKLKAYLISGHFQDIKIDNKTVGYYYKVCQSVLKDNWLAPCLFSNPDLNRLILSLKSELPLDHCQYTYLHVTCSVLLRYYQVYF
jgi:hypothetical protein